MGQSPQLKLVNVAGGFDEPTFVTSFPNNPNLLVIATRGGKLRLVRWKNGLALKYTTPFLNISGRVNATLNGQDGLTGFTFHGRYAVDSGSRWIYVHYTSNDPSNLNQGRIERFWVPIETPKQADITSGEVIWQDEDPLGNGYSTIHAASQLHWGTADNRLYVGVGDHATPSGEDFELLVAQDLTNFWGKILRLEADGAPGTSNPLINTPGVKKEILAYGLRNPFGFSLDTMNGDIWIGDVGFNSQEEINVLPGPNVPTALNYGWPCEEGTVANPVVTGACAGSPMTEAPFHEYAHNPGAAVLGGYVYRGMDIDWDSDGNGAIEGTELRYFFGDYIRNEIRSISPNDPGSPVTVTDHTLDLDMPNLFGPGTNLWGFGRDSAGELYVIRVNNTTLKGTIFQMQED